MRLSNGKKSISFGHKNASDYTLHKNDDRKNRYIDRHKNENWDDPKTAGFYSRWLLWNLQSLEESLKDMNERFKDKNYRFVLRL